MSLHWQIKAELGFVASETLAIHIRHGDKSEGKYHFIQEYADIAACLCAMKGYTTVLMGSDDPATYKDMRRMLRPGIKLVHVPGPPPAPLARAPRRRAVGCAFMHCSACR